MSEAHNGIPHTSRHATSHSLETNVFYPAEGHRDSTASNASNRPAPLQSSYSTPEVPTANGENFNPAITPPKTHSEKIHHHNASLGRIPASAVTPRRQKDSPEREEAKPYSGAQQTRLQASATPFGPPISAVTSGNTTVPQTSMANFQPPFYGYGVGAYIGPPMQVNGQYNPSPSFNGYPPYGNYRLGDNHAKPVGSRRNADGDSAQLSRFTNYPIEHYSGEIYGLCKDQHGCRYLQRKLEERNPEHVQMIFDETCPYVVELMTGMFCSFNPAITVLFVLISC